MEQLKGYDGIILYRPYTDQFPAILEASAKLGSGERLGCP